jgi:MFS family permease
MFYNMMTLSTVAFSPIIGGYISQVHGWRTQFYIISGFLVVGLLMLIFACPEHTYMRNHESRSSTSDEETVNPEKQDTANVVAEISNGPPSESRKSWLQELKPFNRRFSKDNILILTLKPFVCMLYPTVFWAFLIGGCWSAWVIPAISKSCTALTLL